MATIEQPEQTILDVRVEQDGCVANVQNLSETAAQLVVSAPLIADKQAIRGEAIYRMRLCKTPLGLYTRSFSRKANCYESIRRMTMALACP